MKKLLTFFLTFIIYAIVDIAYNIVLGLKIDAYYFERAGITDIFAMQTDRFWLFLLFFIAIALANQVLVVSPSLRDDSTKRAFGHGFILGIAAYATFSLPSAVSILNYPMALPLIHILGGGVFSMCASGFTFLILRKKYART